MRHLSLFTGIGGLDLAAEWAGFETVGQCEFADYPTKVLEKHWPNVPRWRDVRDVTAESVREKCGTVDIISGGFPCQPFSVAGKQKGKEDDRYLWPEMLRVIRELSPSWVFGENVPGILRIAADEVCQDLEREGYEVGVFNFEAAAVGAKHRRERIFFVGYSKHDGQFAVKKLRGDEGTGNKWGAEEPAQTGESQGTNRPINEHGIYRGQFRGKQYSGKSMGRRNTETNERDVAHANEQGMEGSENTRSLESGGANHNKHAWRCGPGAGTWAIEPNVGRVANGIPSRVDRLKCLGNAVVPQQAYPIFKAIMDIENRCEDCFPIYGIRLGLGFGQKLEKGSD